MTPHFSAIIYSEKRYKMALIILNVTHLKIVNIKVGYPNKSHRNFLSLLKIYLINIGISLSLSLSLFIHNKTF